LNPPKALETLYIGENMHHSEPFPVNAIRLADDPEGAMIALRKHRESLRKLTHTGKAPIAQLNATIRRVDIPTPGLSDFTTLNTICIKGDDPFMYSTVFSDYGPSNLQTLRLYHAVFKPLDFENEPASQTIYRSMHPWMISRYQMQNLKNVELVYGPMHDCDIQCLWHEESVRQQVVDRAKQFKELGVKMTIRVFVRENVKPPYLYGEPTPVERLAFDLDGIGSNGEVCTRKCPLAFKQPRVLQESMS
jgi:hypothetical protein